jgi:hypothetical protein
MWRVDEMAASLYEFGSLKIMIVGLQSDVELKKAGTPTRSPDENEVKICAEWLAKFAKLSKRIQRKWTSHDLKELVQKWHRNQGEPSTYVSNGAFILAAVQRGYQVKHASASPNAYFNISVHLPENEWRRIHATGFSRWLFRHVNDRTPIGDLAREAKEDPQWPRRGREFNDFWPLLIGTLAENAFLKAWENFTAKLVPTSSNKMKMRLKKNNEE